MGAVFDSSNRTNKIRGIPIISIFFLYFGFYLFVIFITICCLIKLTVPFIIIILGLIILGILHYCISKIVQIKTNKNKFNYISIQSFIIYIFRVIIFIFSLQLMVYILNNYFPNYNLSTNSQISIILFIISLISCHNLKIISKKGISV